MAVNKVILLGYLGSDPEVKAFASGQSVTNISVATSERYKNKDGEQVEETEWHSVKVWGKLAEVIAKHFKKGDPIYLEGKVKTRKWEDDQGVMRYQKDVIMREFSFVGKLPKAKPEGDQFSSSEDVPF